MEARSNKDAQTIDDLFKLIQKNQIKAIKNYNKLVKFIKYKHEKNKKRTETNKDEVGKVKEKLTDVREFIVEVREDFQKELRFQIEAANNGTSLKINNVVSTCCTKVGETAESSSTIDDVVTSVAPVINALTETKIKEITAQWADNFPSNEINKAIAKISASYRDLDIYEMASWTTIPENIQIYTILINKRQDLEIYMFGNDLVKIPVDFFKHLYEVTYLNLSRNKLTSLDADVFNDLTSLKELYLQQNEIKSLPHGIFDNNVKLVKLCLFNNVFKQIDHSLFQYNTGLQDLKLDSRELTREEHNFWVNYGAGKGSLTVTFVH